MVTLQGSMVTAFVVGLGGVVASGALATGLGWVAQAALAWAGI